MRMSIRCYLGMVGPRGKIVPLIVFVLFFSLPAAGRAQSSANPFREDSASIAKPTPSEIQRLARAAKATPESASARLDFGAALAESDQWQLALEQFEIALKANPENAETIYDIGLTHLMIALNARDHHSKSYDGELDQAQQALLRALGINPNLPRIHEHLGWLYHQIGDQDSAKYPEAVKCYEDALALDVTCSACLLNLESAIRWQGNTEIALKTYEARVQSQRNSPLAHLLYGMILTVAKNHRDAAMAELNSALALTPRLAAAHYYLGQIQYENRNETAAEAEYRIAIKLDPNRPEFLGPLATILIQENKMPEARVILEKSLSLDPANSSAHYKLSLILQRAGEKERAATERAETARLQQQDLEQSKLALNLKRGIADLRAGDAQDAVRELQTAIQFDPNHPETNFYLGIALSQTGDSAASSQAFRKALEFRPESAEIHYNFGIALWRSGQTAPAIAELRRTTEIRPEDAKAHCALGIALLRTGDSAEGQHEIEHAQHLGACEQQPQ
jgi:Flp pilus assembly protein TadD